MPRINTGADYVIRGVGTPTENNDAANKAYVDAQERDTTYDLIARALASGGGSIVLQDSDSNEDVVRLLAGTGITITNTGD